MSALITFQNLSYSTADGRRLFQSLNLTCGAERIGLVGRNGVGKSTLLALIEGCLSPLTGTIIRHGSIGVLRQGVVTSPNDTIGDLFGVTPDLQRLQRIEAGFVSDDDMANADWTLPQRMTAALLELGLKDMEPSRLLSHLSGGQQTRAALAALIFQRPDFILLDEPTNNLDHDGRNVVSHMLSRWNGGALVVSHDRALLREMDSIAELSPTGLKLYGGNWDFYSTKKKAELEVAAQDLAFARLQARKVERKAREAVEKQSRRDAQGKKQRFSAGQSKMLLDAKQDRAQQTQGRSNHRAERQRDEIVRRIDEAEAKFERLKTMSFEIAAGDVPTGKVLLAMNGVYGGFNIDDPVIRGVSMTICGPERLAITGPNGVGKTSFLRLVTGEIPALKGDIRRNALMVMLDQHVGILGREETILEGYRRINPSGTENDARAALARFGFRADASGWLVSDLSGGEKLRAGLACVLGGTHPPELLILDEPTNHLDLASVEAVEAALNAFRGALLVVSHDVDFLAAIGITREVNLQRGFHERPVE